MDEFQKYFGFFLLEYKRVKFYFSEVLIRIILICLRLALPYSVFSALVKLGKIDQSTANAMLWAVLVGQILYGSSLRLQNRVKDDIRSGDISIRLSEPVNYVLAKLFQSFGYFVPTFTTLTIIFFLGLSIFFPSSFNIFILIIFSLFSYLVMNLVNIIVGLTSFIIEENDGVFYITSKFFLIFGNQIIPVALMPAVVIKIAQFTPFYYGLAAPIEAASGRLNLVTGSLTALFYIVFLYLLSQFMLSKLKKKLILNGS